MRRTERARRGAFNSKSSGGLPARRAIALPATPLAPNNANPDLPGTIGLTKHIVAVAS